MILFHSLFFILFYFIYLFLFIDLFIYFLFSGIDEFDVIDIFSYEVVWQKYIGIILIKNIVSDVNKNNSLLLKFAPNEEKTRSKGFSSDKSRMVAQGFSQIAPFMHLSNHVLESA